MRELFDQIERLTPTLSGWCSVEKAKQLATIVLEVRPRVSCEIGVFAGRSFLPIAMAHKALGYGVAIGIEPFENAPSVAAYTGDNQEFWRANVDFTRIRTEFDRVIGELGLEQYVNIIQKCSDEVEPMETGLLHVDGLHTEQAIRDVQRFAPLVTVGGFCVLDDVDWSNDGKQPVKQAAELLESLGFDKLYPLGTGAVFKRVK